MAAAPFFSSHILAVNWSGEEVGVTSHLAQCSSGLGAECRASKAIKTRTLPSKPWFKCSSGFGSQRVDGVRSLDLIRRMAYRLKKKVI